MDQYLHLAVSKWSVRIPVLFLILVMAAIPHARTLAANRAPQLVLNTFSIAYVGLAYKNNGNASDADPGQKLTFSLVSSPSGMTIDPNSGEFTWLPTKEGIYPITLKVTDDGIPRLSDTKQLQLRVYRGIAPAVFIDCGGGGFTDSHGRVYSSDQYYSGATTTTNVSGDIGGTVDDPLFRSQRKGDFFSYKIPSPAASASVVISFVETQFLTHALGKRKFNLSIEGAGRLADYDLAQDVQPMQLHQVRFEVQVMDGELNIDFSKASAGQPMVAAIDVIFRNGLYTVPSSDDAYVRNGPFSSQNFGSDDSLLVKSANLAKYTRKTFIKFPLNQFQDVVTAKLRIYGANLQDENEVGVQIIGTSDSWTEETITWNNSPFHSHLNEGFVRVGHQQRYYEVNVSGIVYREFAGDKIVTFVLTSGGVQNRKLGFLSKESGSNPPQLIIESVLGLNSSPQDKIAQEPDPIALSRTVDVSKIYPNPAKQHFTVEISDQHQTDITIGLLSVTGQEFKLLPDPQAPSRKREIDLTTLALSEGLYVFKIQSAQMTEKMKLIVLK